MPSKEEKQRRAQLLQGLQKKRDDELAEAIAQMPFTKDELRELFDFVDARLEEFGCDSTLRHAKEFIGERKLPEEKTLLWLEEQHGFCDCEVISIVEEAWGETVGSV